MSSDSEPSELSLFVNNERGDDIIRAFTSTSLPAADTEHYDKRDSMNGYDTSSGDEKPPQPPLLKRHTSKLVHHRVVEAHKSPHPSPRLRLVANGTGAHVEEDESSSTVDLTDDDDEDVSQSNSTEREVRTLLEQSDAKLVIVNDCALLYASNSVVVGNNNNVFGDNNFVLGDGNMCYGNHLRAHGACNNLKGEHCTNFDTSRAGSVSGNLSVRIRVIPQSLLMQINKSNDGDVQQIVRRLSLSDKMPVRQASVTSQLTANGDNRAPPECKLSHSAAAAVPDYSTADSATDTPTQPRRRQKKRLRKKKNL